MMYTFSKKSSACPVVTWNKKFLSLLLKSRPESIWIMWNKLKTDLKCLGIPDIRMEYDQKIEVHRHMGMDEFGVWKSQYAQMDFLHFNMQNIFTRGMLGGTSMLPEESLAMAEAFFSMLDTVKASCPGVSCGE